MSTGLLSSFILTSSTWRINKVRSLQYTLQPPAGLTLTKLVDVTNIITDRGAPAINCICRLPSRLTRLNGDLALASIYLQIRQLDESDFEILRNHLKTLQAWNKAIYLVCMK